MDDLSLHLVTNHWWVLLVFAIFLGLFHLLVWPSNRSPSFWKKVDYIWLLTALLGVFAAVTFNRQSVAQNLLAIAKVRLDASAERVEKAVRFGASGAPCIPLLRTGSPLPTEVLDRMQRESDELCAWFREAAKRLLASPLPKRRPLRWEPLGGPPPKVEDLSVTELSRSTQEYNDAVSRFERLSAQIEKSELEFDFGLLSPFLLVIALAFRIAKATGEIRHERQSRMGSPNPQQRTVAQRDANADTER